MDGWTDREIWALSLERHFVSPSCKNSLFSLMPVSLSISLSVAIAPFSRHQHICLCHVYFSWSISGLCLFLSCGLVLSFKSGNSFAETVSWDGHLRSELSFRSCSVSVHHLILTKNSWQANIIYIGNFRFTQYRKPTYVVWNLI